MTEFKKMQKDILNSSNKKILNVNESLDEIKNKLGNKFVDDFSDTDEDDDQSTYRGRHNELINNLGKIKENKNKVVENKKINNNNDKNNDENKDDNEDDNEDEEDEEDDENDELSIDQYEYKEEFEKLIKTYVKRDNEIKILKEKIKDLNQKNEPVRTEIMKHLERLGENCVKINGGTLRVNQYESKGTLKEEIIKEALTEKIKDPKIAEAIFETIDDKREANRKIQKALKRTYERNKK